VERPASGAIPSQRYISAFARMECGTQKSSRRVPATSPVSWRLALAGLTDCGAFLLEATPTKNWTALSRLEGDGGFRAALRANGARLRAHRPGAGCPFGLALFAPLGVVFELFVEEKELLARSEHEIVPAVHALENFVDELHPLPSPLAEAPTEPRAIPAVHCFG